MKVCVVGGGAAGLVAIRRIKSMEGITGTVYEQTGDIGGIWCYRDEQDPADLTSPMYKNLRTNLPKQVMQYIDYPFVKGTGSFVTHEEVQEYLNDYADFFQLRDHIQLRKRVTKLKPAVVSENHVKNGHTKWHVDVEDMDTGRVESNVFDAVIVCSGHFSKATIPKIHNIKVFSGVVMHSQRYRSPELFAGKRVVIIGAGPSGVDISLEISTVATEVIRVFRQVPATPPIAENVVNVGPIIEVKENGFIFEGNVEKTADFLILATGYDYDCPFLDETCHVKIEEGKFVTPLYQQLIHVKYPTLCFIGLPVRILPFYLFDIQVRYFLEHVTGKFRLPSSEEMEKYYLDEIECKKGKNLPYSQWHVLGPAQWEYYERLATEAGFESELKPVFRKIFHHVEQRRRDFPAVYRNDTVELIDDSNYVYQAAEE